MPTTDNTSIQSLVALGFSPIEAEVYAFLLRESPATGYRIAQAIGKPAANTYKAMESLEKKAAVIVDEGSNRLCRAVPARELIANLEQSFARRRDQAAEMLSRIERSREETDDRIYQLRSAEQVIERSRQMLARSRKTVLIDAFPLLIEELRESIEKTARRGVKVAIKVYVPTKIPRVDVVLNPHSHDVMKRYPGQLILLISDGKEHLMAFLSDDAQDVNQAVWSGSINISWAFQVSLTCEFVLCSMITSPKSQLVVQGARDASRRMNRFFALDNPGYKMLLQRLSKSQGAQISRKTRPRKRIRKSRSN